MWDATHWRQTPVRRRIAEGQVQQILFQSCPQCSGRDARRGATRDRDTPRRSDDHRGSSFAPVRPAAMSCCRFATPGEGWMRARKVACSSRSLRQRSWARGPGWDFLRSMRSFNSAAGRCRFQVASVSGRPSRCICPGWRRLGLPTTLLPHVSTRSELAGLTILLVEDEDEIREIMSETLSEAGGQVLQAVDGESALEQVAAHGPAVDLLGDRCDDAGDERASTGRAHHATPARRAGDLRVGSPPKRRWGRIGCTAEPSPCSESRSAATSSSSGSGMQQRVVERPVGLAQHRKARPQPLPSACPSLHRDDDSGCSWSASRRKLALS